MNRVDRSVGAKIRSRRAELSLTQDDLAGATQLSLRDIAAYENGTERVPPEALLRISAVLKAIPSDFLEADGGAIADGLAPDEAAAKKDGKRDAYC